MTDTTTIDIAPIVAALAPYVVSAVVAIVGAAITAAAAAFVRWTGLQMQQAALDSVRHAAENEAGALVGEAANNAAFANAKITMSSPIVGTAVSAIVDRIPAAIRASGVTPEQITKMVLGAIGRQQAAIPVVAAAPVLK